MKHTRQRYRKSESKLGYTLALILVLLGVAVAVLLLLHYSAYSTALLTLQEINAKFPNAYQYVSQPKCYNAAALNGSGIMTACSEALNLSNASSALPDNVTLFYYKFSSGEAAQSYLQVLSSQFNSTPWAIGTTQFQNLSTGTNAVPLYFVTEVGSNDPVGSNLNNARALLTTVLTVFTYYNTTVLGASSYQLTASNKTMAEQVLVNLLYYQYKGISAVS